MSAFDKALDERNRQLRNYRATKRAQLLELYADPLHGEWLRKFITTLGHFGAEHADRMLEYVEREARKWLATAPIDIRYAALEAIDNRCVAIRTRAGMPPFEDPMPWEEPNVFFAAKGFLGL